MLKDFKTFLLRGNVLDLAIAVVIGSAFTAVVTALVKDFITPLIAAIGGKHNFSALTFALNGSKFMYGDFINQLISFLIIAFVVFFFVVQPMNQLIKIANRRKAQGEPVEEPAAKDPQLVVLEEIRDAFKKNGRKV